MSMSCFFLSIITHKYLDESVNVHTHVQNEENSPFFILIFWNLIFFWKPLCSLLFSSILDHNWSFYSSTHLQSTVYRQNLHAVYQLIPKTHSETAQLSILVWVTSFVGRGLRTLPLSVCEVMRGWSHALSPLEMFSPRQEPSSLSPKTQFPLNNQSQFCDITCWTADSIIIGQFCNSVLAGVFVGRYMSVCACVFRCVFVCVLPPTVIVISVFSLTSLPSRITRHFHQSKRERI